MGTVRDYYRPDPSAKTSNKNGIDLCYLLTHHDSFQWSPNAEGTWRAYFVFVISDIDWGCNLVVNYRCRCFYLFIFCFIVFSEIIAFKQIQTSGTNFSKLFIFIFFLYTRDI